MARGKKAEEKAAKGNAKGSQKRKAEEEEDAEVEDEDEELELTEEDDDKAAEEAEGDNDKENQGKKEKAKETSKKASPRQGEGAGGGDDGAASRASKKSKESSGDGDGDGGDAHSRVLLYMRRANRPYSCTVLFENLHHEIGKAALQRILDDLTTQKKLTMKEFGKAALYWLTQEDSSDAGSEQLAKLDQQVAEVTARVTASKASAASLRAECSTLSAEPGDAELDAALAELERAVPVQEKKVERLKSGVDAVSPDEVDALQRKVNMYIAEWKKRKRGCKEMLGMIAENAAKSWKEKKFCEEVGVETDEERKVQPNDYATLYRDMPAVKPAGKGKAKK